jgi:hypothetical protein
MCAALRRVDHRLCRPTGNDTGRGHPFLPSHNSVWVPHVRTSVRGLIKTGRSPIKALKTFPESRSWVPHISLVFGEMWDSTALSPKIFPAKCSYPTLRIKAEDGDPDLCVSGEGLERAAGRTADPSTALRSGRDDKGRAGDSRGSCEWEGEKEQVPPLRFAQVGMTILCPETKPGRPHATVPCGRTNI